VTQEKLEDAPPADDLGQALNEPRENLKKLSDGSPLPQPDTTAVVDPEPASPRPGRGRRGGQPVGQVGERC